MKPSRSSRSHSDSRRKLTVYLPPDSSRAKRAAWSMRPTERRIDRYARVLEPLITAGKIPPMIWSEFTAAATWAAGPTPRTTTRRKTCVRRSIFPGSIRNGSPSTKRSSARRFAAWAEREWKVSHDPKDRVIFGCSNGARFVFEMAMRHPDQFGSRPGVLGPGGGEIILPENSRRQRVFTWKQARGNRQFQVIHVPARRGLEASRRAGRVTSHAWADTTRRSGATNSRARLLRRFGLAMKRHFDRLGQADRIGRSRLALKVIGTFQIRLRIRQRLDGSLQTNVSSESFRSIFSPASGALARGTVILNSVFGWAHLLACGRKLGSRGCLPSRAFRPGRSSATLR